MKNLQNLGVQELSAKEIKETQGGYFWVIVRTIAAVATIAREVEEGVNWYSENSRRY